MALSVILLGDSIRMGYEPVVRRELHGAEVFGPEENCGNSRFLLANLQRWLPTRKADVIHVNCGLHDLRRNRGEPGPVVPLEEYRQNVRQILQSLLATGARVIWATTTDVNERWHREQKPFDRQEADVRQYNAGAGAVAAELGVSIDDLFALVEKAGHDKLLRPDGVHFTPEGYELLGKAVAGVIRQLSAPRQQ